MRWVTFREPGSDGGKGADRVGLVVGDEIRAVATGTALVDLLGDDGERLADAGAQVERRPAGVFRYDDVTLRPPIPHPPAIRDFTSFEEHMRAGLQAQGFELGKEWYESPAFWFCNPNSSVASGDDVVVPGHTRQMDYELEVGAIVGRECIDLGPDEADSAIVGYCIMNDWSARDLQREEMHRVPVGPAKGKDFATGFGPMLVTADELADRRKDNGFDLTMTAHVNGRLYSSGNWSAIHWSFAEMLSFASRHCRIYPGDILGSGTVGTGCILELSGTHGSDAYPWLEDGDEVVLDVERLGRMRNRIVRGGQPKPLR